MTKLDTEIEVRRGSSSKRLEALSDPMTGPARLHLLWGSRRLLWRSALCGLLAAALLAFVIPPRYESEVSLAPPDASGLGSAAAMLSTLAGKMGGLTSLAEGALGVKGSSGLFVGILNSANVQDQIVKKFELQREYRKRYVVDARKELARHTTIAEDRDSGVISVTVTDHDPYRAAEIAQAYVNELNRVVNDVSTSSARRERVFLEQRLRQVNDDLHNAESEFSRFASDKSAIDIQAQGKAMVEAGATLQGELIAAQSEVQGLREIYSDDNVRVRSAQARVLELRRSLEKLGGKGSSEKSSVDELYPSLRQLPLLGVAYADLYRKVKVEEVVFATLTQEYEMAKVQEAREIPAVKVLDPPLVPEKKSFPPRLLIIAAGPLLAFALMAAYLIGRARWVMIDGENEYKRLILEMTDVAKIAAFRTFDSRATLKLMTWRRRPPLQ